MKWEDVDVVRIYMKSGAVFQYYDFTDWDNGFGSIDMFASKAMTPGKNIQTKQQSIIQIIKTSEIESIEFEVKHGS